MGKTSKADDAELPELTRVVAIRTGYACPYGETRMRTIKAGEEFIHEGKLGLWMVPAEQASKVKIENANKVPIPTAIQRAMGRASSLEGSRAREAEEAMQEIEGRAALNREKRQGARKDAAEALARQKAAEANAATEGE